MTVEIELLEPRHAAAVQILASQPEVLATTRLPNPYPPDGASQFIEATRRARAAGTEFVFAVVVGGELVGTCGVRDIDRETATGEVGYFIGREHWGRGHATAATRMLLDYARDVLELRRVSAVTLERNPASARVLEKLGFRLARRFADHTGAFHAVGDVIVGYELEL